MKDFKIDKEFYREIQVRSLKPNEMLDDIKDYIELMKKEKRELYDKLKKLKEEYDKDEEVRKLKDTIELYQSNNLYIMSDSQKDKVQEFSRNHYNSCKGNIHYEIFPTPIGKTVYVVCNKCGEKIDITEYGEW